MSEAASVDALEISTILRSCVETGIRRWRGDGRSVREIRQAPSELTTSYPVTLLDIYLDDGSVDRVLLKDFSDSRLPKPGRPRQREPRVYEELLDGAALGTPAYLGNAWSSEPGGARWLLIEFVEAKKLKAFEFDDWLKAVAWVARLHAAFASQPERLDACDILEVHDAEFFSAHAERARWSMSHCSAAFMRRLIRVLDRYQEEAERAASLPRTLVHGSFRPRNVLLDRGVETDRIVTIDWELAAQGSGLYDLGFFAQGFGGSELDVLIETYRNEAIKHSMVVPDAASFPALLDWFRLQKELKSLGDAFEMGYAANTIDKILCLAESLRR